MLLCFKLQEHVNEHAPKWTVHFPKLLLALSVSVMDDIYKKIAIKLNDWGKIHSNSECIISSFKRFNLEALNGIISVFNNFFKLRILIFFQ